MFCIPASLALLRAPLISSTFEHVLAVGGSGNGSDNGNNDSVDNGSGNDNDNKTDQGGR